MSKFYKKYNGIFRLRNLLTLSLIGGVLITVIFLPLYSDLSQKKLMTVFLYNALLTIFLSLVNGFISNNVNISWLEQPLKRFFVSLFLTIIGTVMVALFVRGIIGNLLFNVPVLVLLKTLDTEYYYNVIMITLVISTFLHGRAFLFELRRSIEKSEALKRAHLSSQYESLKNQVNPHFLFNSLNVLTALVHKDADLSEKFIRQLANVYRYVLEVNDQELVSLEKEKEALLAYIFLLKIRFGDNIIVELDIEDTENQLIPPLALQMLVENAVKHNIVSKEQPLRIKLVLQANDQIFITNNLQKKEQQANHLGIGLENIKKRYQKFIDKEVIIKESEKSFEVLLPIIKLSPATL